MALSYLFDPNFQFQDKNGVNNVYGHLEVFIDNSDDHAPTYRNFTGTFNPERIVLDNNGRAVVIVDELKTYRIEVYDRSGNMLWTQYPVRPTNVNYGDNNIFNYYADIYGTPDEIDVDVETSASGVKTFTIKLANAVKTVIGNIQSTLSSIIETISTKKDKQQPYSVSGNSTKTVKSVSQNANGDVSVEFEDIEFPQQVPNVNITSPNDTIDVQSSVDPQTNTKTFEIDVKSGDPDDTWAHFENSDTWTSIAHLQTLNVSNALTKKEGTLTDSLTIPAGLYDFKLELAYRGQQCNVYDKVDLYIDYGNRRLSVGSFLFDNSIEGIESRDYQTEWSGGIFKMTEAGTISISAKNLTDTNANLKVSHLYLRRVGTSTSGGSGSRYTEGDGIKIENDKISVNYGSGLEVDPQTNELKVKIGKGLKFDENTLEVEIDSDVEDVVETVEKISQDLDTKLTVNFDMAQIDNCYDFAAPSVTTLSNGATMLFQAFTVPINNSIRLSSNETDPTLLGIYAKQGYGTKIMLAIYQYDFETGYSDYVADTGPVTVKQGRNEFAIKHQNPYITELRSSCVYYAALYLPSSHGNGLLLAGCPGYGSGNFINAIPRFTIGAENIIYNGSEIDMTDANTGRLDYNDGNGNYYIGPWSDGYNERPGVPRFFMQLRNGEEAIPVSTDPFTDIGAYTLKATSSVQDVFGSSLTPLSSGVIYQAVQPAQNVAITEWTVYDTNATDSLQFGGNVYPSDFDNQNMVSQTSSCTVTELGEIGTGTGIYGHKYTPNTPIQLSANTTYRFPACVATPGGLSNAVVQYDTPTVQKDLHLFESGYNVNQWVSYARANGAQGTFLKLKDSDNNEYVI
ncbi:MAG: hypothetical protein J6W22_05925 [Fibrobacter sp.]|nr:hypothetical protein [Fibrobacter sp.]